MGSRAAISTFGQLRRFITAGITLVLAGTLLTALPAVAQDSPWSGTASVAVSRAEVDVHDMTAVVTATASSPVKSPYYLTIYDDQGHRLAYCNADYTFTSGCAGNGDTATATVSVSNNATGTYTAYVSLDVPIAAVPSSDVRAVSDTASIHNTGWSGTAIVAVSRAEVDVHDMTAVVTATASSPVKSPYYLTIYDDQGHRLAYCSTNDSSCGATGTTVKASVSVSNNATGTYTAYVSQDMPTTYLPSSDVRAVSNTASIHNTGWSGTALVAVSRTEVDVHNTSAVVTATSSSPVKSPYYLTIYDDQGHRLAYCNVQYAFGSGCGANGDTATATVSVSNNATGTYTAYVSQDMPGTYLPSSDVRAVSNTASVHNTGWSGTALVAVSRAEVDVHDKTAVVTATASSPVKSPYFLTIYDDQGHRLAYCNVQYAFGSGCGAHGDTATATVSVSNNTTGTYTAYVSQDMPSTYLPSSDVRAKSNTATVRNLGWNGSVQLTRDWNSAGNQMSLTATASSQVTSPYWLTIYDDQGHRLAYCNASYAFTSGCAGNGDTAAATVSVSSNETRTYTAYVSQDVPSTSIPTTDVRAISGRVTTAGYGPTSAGETAGGSNPSEPCSQRCQNDPVNTVTGEFWEGNTDLAAAASSPLAFQRSFATTRSQVDGPLGFGRTTNFDMTMSVPVGVAGSLATASQVQVRQENGSVLVFTRSGDGRFGAPARVMATLEQSADGTFVFTREHRQRFQFGATGRLAALQDLNGNTVTLTYTGSTVTRAADSRGAFIDIAWSGSHITGVTDHTGRHVTYTYSAAGDLTAVTLPDGATTAYTYDSAHRVVSMTKPGGGVTTNAYDTAGRVTTQTDAVGRATTFAYGADQTTITDPDGSVTIQRYIDGQVLSETKAAGTPTQATTTFTYGPTNQVTSTTDPAGRVTRSTYDASGNRTSITDPLGRVSTSTYDGLGDPTSVTNSAGEITSFTYDERGNLLSTRAPDGATTTHAVNADGTVASSADPLGRVTTNTYDAHGNPATATGPDGSVVTMTTDTLGRVLSATDPRGTVAGANAADYTSTYIYDAAGRRTSSTNPLGAVTSVAYDAAGLPATATSPLGAVTRKEYDLAGQLIAVIDAAGARTTITYDGAGRVATVTDPTGAVTSRAYDGLGRVVAVTDPLGRVTRTEYDTAGQVSATVTPSGARTTYSYDAAGQLTSTTNPLGAVTSTTYDLAGRPVTVTDADGRAVTTVYDAVGRATGVHRADGTSVSWAYDAAGETTTYTDAAGAVTTYTYDSAGHQATSTDTAGRVTHYAYDPAGQLTTRTTADDQHTSYAYDPAARLTGVDYSDATPDVTNTYDAAGRRTSMTDATGTTTNTYDALGHLVSQTAGATTTGYTWDSRGNLTTLTYPSGQAVTDTYDAAGQLTKVTDWQGRDYTYTWTGDGQTATLTDPNGVTTTYTHDAVGQVLGIAAKNTAGTSLLDLAYSYTAAGSLASQTTDRTAAPRGPPAAGPATSTYAWDPLGRISAITGAGAGTVTFNTAGSVTTLSDGRTLTYDNAAQPVTLTTPATGAGTTAQTTSFTYDARGNRVTAATDTGPGAGTTGYTYDLANRLTALTGANGTPTVYTYNGAGLRASATTGTGTQAVTEHYTWDTTSSIPVLLTDATHAYIYGAGSTPLAQVALTGGHADYLHTDLLGSIRTTTSDTGQVTSDADYDTYGLAKAAGGVPSSTITRFGYAGQYTDPTGLIYLRARYYDPATAQFLTRDPLEATTRNAYGYTAGNPLQFTDPLGLDALDDASNWIAGFGDALTFGGTREIRKLINYGLNGETTDVVDHCSVFYEWGGHGGLVASLVPLGAGTVRAAAWIGGKFPEAAALVARVTSKVGSWLPFGASKAANTARSLPTTAEAADLLSAAKPTGSALQRDAMHRAGDWVIDDVAQNGSVFDLVGGDGVSRTLVQMPGEVNGVAGRFEWIMEGQDLTHQLFVRGGTINGIPIKP